MTTTRPTTKLTSPSQVALLLKEFNIRPRKKMGQNFLVDENIRNIILETAAPAAGDAVLEVGPGLGVLTERLVGTAGRVVAIEKDAGLCRYLRERLGAEPGLELIEADVLDVDLEGLLESGLGKVVSNLPYGVGSRVLVDLLASERRPERIVVTIQRDVADRLVADAGSKAYGLLTIWGSLHYEISIRKTVRPSCFLPAPAVHSAVVKLDRRPRPLAEVADRQRFDALVKHAFSQRRKQIGTLLQRLPRGLRGARSPAELLERAGLEARVRPEEIPVEQWARLSNALGGDEGSPRMPERRRSPRAPPRGGGPELVDG